MSKEVIRNDEAIRILVVEDDPSLVKEMQSQLELKLRSLVSEHGYEFSELIVNVQSTIETAKYTIKNDQKFHLFILDISVKAARSQDLQGNGLTLIQHAISEEKKPNAVVVLTSCDEDAREKGGSDLGHAIVGRFYHPRSHISLHKNASASKALANLVAFLSEKVKVEGKEYSRLISLVMFQAFFTISRLKDDEIEVRFSEYAEPYRPSNDRVRKFLLYLARRKLLSETEIINDVFNGEMSKDSAQAEMSRIKKRFLIGEGHFREEDINLLYSKVRNIGYRLADEVRLEGFD